MVHDCASGRASIVNEQLAAFMSQRGDAALSSACYAGRLEVVKWLVSEGHSDAKRERSKVVDPTDVVLH
jgi:hypothetical protein